MHFMIEQLSIVVFTSCISILGLQSKALSYSHPIMYTVSTPWSDMPAYKSYALKNTSLNHWLCSEVKLNPDFLSLQGNRNWFEKWGSLRNCGKITVFC